ncbi:PH domain-containing protein [Pleionea sp. CnH1-48]|uniref:PH domain-containing protein n=1 Tax=Pleionea sp. CnH1-48 TaxID=2954494 RepID=UPI00209837E8|nr:PH domain-containing protein [Pleionea sp. CnH1-48]MCO7224123.1 PH domain-containing protein [Pleionea sp. CnH1-48]
MNEIIVYFENNPSIWLLFIPIYVAVLGPFFFWGWKKSKALFDGVDFSQALFREKGVSGHSKKSLITRMGGARNALDVSVTETDLCIKGTFFAFTAMGFIGDLTRKTPLEDIKSVSRVKGRIEVAFHNESSISLVLKDEEGFIKALKKDG